MGGMRSDMGSNMRGNGHQANGMKRRWDTNGGSNDQGLNKRPYQQNSQYGGSSTGGGYQQKPFRSNPYDQSKSAVPSATSYQPANYGKFASYAPMQMPPSLASYPAAVTSAIANYTFPPPNAMPPLPKN